MLTIVIVALFLLLHWSAFHVITVDTVNDCAPHMLRYVSNSWLADPIFVGRKISQVPRRNIVGLLVVKHVELAKQSVHTGIV